MIASELKSKLLSKGCCENNFAVLSSGDDVFCLDKRGHDWVVFYTGRGCDSEPIFSSTSESDACQYFHDYILKMDHWHIVGFFKNELEAEQLEDNLKNARIKFIRNDIPAYSTRNDPRYRVFIVGKDIFKYRELFGNESIVYA